MSDQSTLQRTIEMMAMLSQNRGRTIESMAEHFEVTTRTIRRTIQTIRESGYIVECINGIYRIEKEKTKNRYGFDIGDLLHFSKEEAHILNAAISTIETTSGIKEALVSKLYSLYNSDKVVKSVAHREDSQRVKIMMDSIRNRTQVIIQDYTYGSSNNGLRNFVVEPLGFAFNYSRCWVYSPGLKRNISVRLSNVAGIKASDTPFKHIKKHKIPYSDPFRGYGFERTKVKLELNIRAYVLMIDDFPLTKEYIKPLPSSAIAYYEFESEVCGFKEIGRFILGLSQDIQIIEPLELKEYIRGELLAGLEQIEDVDLRMINH